MIATRGFVRTTHFSHARLSHFPSDAVALRVGQPQIQLGLIGVLVCRGYRIPCSDCSLVIREYRSHKGICPRIVLCCAAYVAALAFHPCSRRGQRGDEAKSTPTRV